MSAGRLRDEEQLRLGLERWLEASAEAGDALGPVRRLQRPAAGYANETVVVTLDGGRRLVLRLPPLLPLFPRYDLAAQAMVHQFLAERGLPVPSPVTLVDDGLWLGAPFLVMPFVDGHVLGEAPSLDPWLARAGAAAQARVHHTLLELLAQLHRLDWETSVLAQRLRGARQGLADELAWWERYVTWVAADDQIPAPLADGLARCQRFRPDEEPPHSLLWGDVRLGNVIVPEQIDEAHPPAIAALLDWELASIGPAEMDLAWYLALDEAVVRLVGRPEGFPDRQSLIEEYQSLLGRPLMDLDWHEAFAIVRALAISWCQLRVEARAQAQSTPPLERRHPLVVLLEEHLERLG